MSELHLVRHAQASFGSDNYDQLSDLGHRQSRLLGGHFKLKYTLKLVMVVMVRQVLDEKNLSNTVDLTVEMVAKEVL